MKIVVDENVPLSKELFGRHGEVYSVPGRALDARLLAQLAPDALIVRSVTKVDAALFSQHSPSFVGSCTIGIDHIDAQYLEGRAIKWAHAPGCNAQSVVEYVTSSLNSLGYFDRDEISRLSSLSASVIGCGRVGSEVYAELLALGFDVTAYDPFLTSSPFLRLVSLEQAMSADVVCIHTPLTTDGMHPTKGMIGKDLLNRLPPHGMVVNAGRGGVIDEDALLTIARERRDLRWVIDVWSGEPKISAELMERVDISTPHVAGYSMDGKRNGSYMIYREFCDHFDLVGPPRDSSAAEFLELDEDRLDSLSDTLRAIYDPTLDSIEMKRRYQCADEASIGSGDWFDTLRKQYPVRRERAKYFLSKRLVDRFSVEEKHLATLLGFGGLLKD